MACDILIVTMIVFFLKYRKTMQAMLAVFLQINTKNSGLQSVQADQIGRTYPPLFTINLLKEEEILDDLKEISTMEYVVQVIMIMYLCSDCHTRPLGCFGVFLLFFSFFLLQHVLEELAWSKCLPLWRYGFSWCFMQPNENFIKQEI